MIAVDKFVHALDSIVSLYTGVPDSLLGSFCAYLHNEKNETQHIWATNEGSALAIASGHYLATHSPALVYMQNSGIGNAINPLLSIMDAEVYRIPALLMIGWRGEPGIADEPQHKKQGAITLALLQCMGIAYEIIDGDTNIAESIERAREVIATGTIYAFVVKADTFIPYTLQTIQADMSLSSRESALEQIVLHMKTDTFFVATTGKIARELFEIRKRQGQTHSYDFLCVGAMGHVAQIAAIIALHMPHKQVVCLDGDGSFLMHMGSLATIGNLNISNFIHIVLNNACHDSVGGQPTYGDVVDMHNIAQYCQYDYSTRCVTMTQLYDALEEAQKKIGSFFIEMKVKKGARKDLGRPTISPQQCKNDFIRTIIAEKEN